MRLLALVPDILTTVPDILTTVAGNGSFAWTPDGVQATQGGFTRILGLAVDADDSVYFDRVWRA